MDQIREWFRRHFSDPQVVALAVLLLVVGIAIAFMGRLLAPFLAGVVIAYLLDAPANRLRAMGCPHLLAVSLVFLAFIGLSLFAALALLPMLFGQLSQLATLLPTMIGQAQELLLELPQRYPKLIDPEAVLEISAAARQQLLNVGQGILRFSFDRLNSLFNLVVYVFLVPLVVWFLLKDKRQLLDWFARFLPDESPLVRQVWTEVYGKTGDYVRGKVYEIAIIGLASWLAFLWLDLNFAALLAVLTGLSVLIPYIGVAAVAFPVALVALFQFGVSADFVAVLVAYGVIQAIDGNLLAPVLLSEVVRLHPIAIVVAILLFGGLWGFWGLFFSIPLATVADSVLRAWPSNPSATEKA